MDLKWIHLKQFIQNKYLHVTKLHIRYELNDSQLNDYIVVVCNFFLWETFDYRFALGRWHKNESVEVNWSQAKWQLRSCITGVLMACKWLTADDNTFVARIRKLYLQIKTSRVYPVCVTPNTVSSMQYMQHNKDVLKHRLSKTLLIIRWWSLWYFLLGRARF